MRCKSCGRYFDDSEDDICPFCGYKNIISMDGGSKSQPHSHRYRIVSKLRIMISFILHTVLLNIICGLLSSAVNIWWNRYSRRWGDSECYEARLEFTKLSLLRVLYYISCYLFFFINIGILITKGFISLIYTIFPFLG